MITRCSRPSSNGFNTEYSAPHGHNHPSSCRQGDKQQWVQIDATLASWEHVRFGVNRGTSLGREEVTIVLYMGARHDAYRQTTGQGVVVSGSLIGGLEMKLDEWYSVEDIRAGKFVVIEEKKVASSVWSPTYVWTRRISRYSPTLPTRRGPHAASVTRHGNVARSAYARC